ncbi:MAG: C4-dicarboxylate ABC transporter [Flavobacteriaceae bacterium]|jgi:protein-S-isoprenylcysteine O-methyltransferase Ste14|nr:C4-dicarboxylate ABC transporter [Flavobacteriaceae bacterium]
MTKFLHIIIGILYIVLGAVTLITNIFIFKELQPEYSRPLGGVLIVYGIFRMVRKFKKERNV